MSCVFISSYLDWLIFCQSVVEFVSYDVLWRQTLLKVSNMDGSISRDRWDSTCIASYFFSLAFIWIHRIHLPVAAAPSPLIKNLLYQIFCKLQLLFTPSGFYQGSQNESPNIRVIAARAERHSSPLPWVSNHVPLHLSRHPARKWCASEKSLASHFVGVWMCRAPPRSLAVEAQQRDGAYPLRGPQGLSAEWLRRIAGGPARRPAID